MSVPAMPERTAWVERMPGLDGWGVWAVCHGGPTAVDAPRFGQFKAAAERSMAERPELASVSATSELRFISGRTAELLGILPADDKVHCPVTRVEEWLATATLKGLPHEGVAAGRPGIGLAPERIAIDPPPFADAISVGIDAAWLAGTESGAQVAVVELIRELARRPEIARIVLISDAGVVPSRLAIPKVSGVTWAAALAGGTPMVDVMHRPYQPGADVDFRRYLRVGSCVALTVLDLIAYDNPGYHESAWWQRRYQDAFDEQVCLADCVFAISRHVGSRLEQQFGERLSGPVRSVLLGTDHLYGGSSAAANPGPALKPLDGTRFLLVLGNDFAHKNRDFAVKVFADLRDRGYDGRLAMVGVHLDNGSSFRHELSGAGRHREEVIRRGSVSNADKVWLLQNAQVVLYPTSAEGFGLVPFEAAALGTPTAFVRFGPLRETLPDVEACAGWQVRPFADHVLGLIENPARQVAAIRAAGAALTWSSHVDQVLDGYRHMLGPDAPWRTRGRVLPGWPTRWRRAADLLSYRAGNKLRRLAGRSS